MPNLLSVISGPPFFKSRDILIGGQSFVLRSRIVELWLFKGHKVENNHKEDRIAFFKAGLWRLGFFGCGNKWYHFQQELMLSKMIV